MQPTRDQILKFFKRECTSEEAELIRHYLSEHPLALEEYLSESEWLETNKFSAPDADRSERMLQNILGTIEFLRPQKTVKLNRRWVDGLAACILVACCYFLWMHLNPAKKPVQASIATTDQGSLKWRSTNNQGRLVMHIMLDDGSHVALEPHSTIRYTIPFKREHRDIQLKGQAKFYVAKDKHRPFTVYAGPLATTALGTVFKVTAWPKGKHTKVHLLSGKVKVVQYQLHNANASAVYLLPGKQLVFNNGDRSALVSTYQDRSAKPVITMPPGTTQINGDTLNFRNQQLPLVINELQEAYNIRINTRVRLNKYYFTGEVNSHTETVQSALRTITSLNKLNYVQLPDSTYLITKP